MAILALGLPESPVAAVIVVAIMALVYFAPAITAYQRRHANAPAILMLNFFLGWTFLGWVFAAVWAYTDNVKQPPAPREYRPKPRATRIYEDYMDEPRPPPASV